VQLNACFQRVFLKIIKIFEEMRKTVKAGQHLLLVCFNAKFILFKSAWFISANYCVSITANCFEDAGPSTAPKQWKHWRKTFENYVEDLDEQREEGRTAFNKLEILLNCVSHDVYDVIEDCATFYPHDHSS